MHAAVKWDAKGPYMQLTLRRLVPAGLLALALGVQASSSGAQTIPTFSQVIVFGDSLSDDGNIANLVENRFGIRYPGQNFNYADGRFTNNGASRPASARFAGVWHEQLSQFFLRLPVSRNSLDGGIDYAYGGATTKDGNTDRTVISNPTPFGGGQITITIANMGQQVTNYLSNHTPDPQALYVVWGGGNDLFDDASAANVTATANRAAALVSRLAQAGARNFLVPNVPALGSVPHYIGQPAQQASLNAASQSYRTQLAGALDAASSALTLQGINARVYRLDIYNLFLGLVGQPGYFGFTNVIDSAQDKSVVADNYLFWDDIHPTAAAHFQIGAAAARVLAGGDIGAASLANVSSRASVGTGENVLIAGFVIRGTVNKSVLLRALGPSLAAAGVSGTLANPSLTLVNDRGQIVNTNDDWRTAQAAAITATGFAPTNDRESALLATLAPGAYTVIVSGVGDTSGVGLVEAYDLDTPMAPLSRPINVSTRARVLPGDGTLIGGFVIQGSRSKRVIIRAIGPSLAASGVTGALLDPVVTVVNSQGQALATNDDWKTTQQTEIAATPFAPRDDRESAVILTLAPGAYTAVVTGKSGLTGVALVEVYDLD